MSIRAGQILNVGDGFIIDRLQTGGVSSLNIPQDKVYEVGSRYSLTTIRDIPDLSFDMESTEVSCKTEAILLGMLPSAITDGYQVDFNNAVPLSISSPFRSALTLYNITKGVVVPHLYLKSVAYRFGLKANATQTFSLAGDSIFYIPAVPYEDVFTSDGTTTTFTLSQTALEYYNTTLGESQFIVNASVYNPDGTAYRLFNGENFDYTDSDTGFTLNAGTTVPVTGAKIRVQYGSLAAENIPASENLADGIGVAPAAIRAKDIDVYVGNSAATPTFTRWTGVQSVDCTWSVNLEADQEFGNPLDIDQDYTTPDVSGTIGVRSANVADLFQKIAEATNVPADQVAGTLSSTPVPVEFRLNDPDTGARLKTLYVPDARFTPPAMQARANSKLDTSFPFTSDTGLFYVYNGVRPGSN